MYYRLCICPHVMYIKYGIGTEKPSGSGCRIRDQTHNTVPVSSCIDVAGL
jgi:hypothetical protein